ncbi:SDR family oxidoreductase [Natronomonas sp. F2-12]|jgi:NAD(P)-dependent dehydrogenase (short-subunit alcohol dehydrogenase family)|uniref:SDR family oxidoreductase n=1 Tax=Natronomonas aquatica TaxID=2841590 RepID=A0A9R1D6D6_9EURY|nr:SDR family oxidoreductase [Natronomonas aquatica]MCQ4331900.1 SDR family oxidoreductase [Natronomonas aquatica]
MPQAELPIDGERAAISAAGTGIGREIARQLTASGVDVAVNDIDADALSEAETALAETPGDVLAVQGDASEPDDMAALVDRAVDRFGGLDILVNNVGIAGPTKPCEEVSHDEFMRTLEVNLGGQFSATKAAIPHLKASDAGRVINLASISGKRPLEHRTPYATAKMGVVGFTRTLALELAPHDVTVNAICPGSVEGDRIEAVIENQARSRDIPYEEARREMVEASPMETFVQQSDIADTVLFLCSRRAEHITGQDLNVSSGQVMY